MSNETPVREKPMSAPASAVTTVAVEKADVSNLVQQESPKLLAQIDDDAERIRSSIARLTSNSVDELETLASDLTSELRELQEYLKSEGERVQREIMNYAHLNQDALAAIKNIIETTSRAPQMATGRRRA